MPKKVKSEAEKAAYKEYQKYIKSEDFRKVHDAVIERDHHHCMFCGRNDTEDGAVLTAHHNTYKHLYNEMEHLDDLVCVCKSCHYNLHRIRTNWNRFKIINNEND